MSGAVGIERAIVMLFGLTLVLMGLTFSLLVTVRRKHTELEQVFGSGGRKAEVLIAIGGLYLGVFAGVYGILIDFFSISLFSYDGFAAVVMFVVQFSAILLLLHPKVRSLHREYRETYLLGR